MLWPYLVNLTAMTALWLDVRSGDELLEETGTNNFAEGHHTRKEKVRVMQEAKVLLVDRSESEPSAVNPDHHPERGSEGNRREESTQPPVPVKGKRRIWRTMKPPSCEAHHTVADINC